MKLKELVEKIFEDETSVSSDNMIGVNIQNQTLYGEKVLSQYKDKLLACEEFKEVTDIEFMSTPTISVDGKPLVAQSLKIGDNTKLKGKCYLLSVMITPEIYEPNSINKIVKDGATITPTLYNPITFEPLKKIILSFSPERPMNELGSEEIIRKELHNLLDKVFDNPKEYLVKGVKNILIRGIFENVEDENFNSTEILSGEINKQDNNPDHFMVFYMKKNSDNSVKLEHKILSTTFKNKFLERFKDKTILTEEEIEEFLK